MLQKVISYLLEVFTLIHILTGKVFEHIIVYIFDILGKLPGPQDWEALKKLRPAFLSGLLYSPG